MKTMIVHDEGESDAGSTPCKDSTLIVRQVLAEKTTKKTNINHLSHTFCCFGVLRSFIPLVFFHFVCMLF